MKSDGERVAGSDTAEGTEERAIRAIPIVTTLSYVRAVKDKARGVRVTLTIIEESMAAVKNHNRHQFTSRKSAPRCELA